jgi:hypothetical protein
MDIEAGLSLSIKEEAIVISVSMQKHTAQAFFLFVKHRRKR